MPASSIAAYRWDAAEDRLESPRPPRSSRIAKYSRIHVSTACASCGLNSALTTRALAAMPPSHRRLDELRVLVLIGVVSPALRAGLVWTGDPLEICGGEHA